MGEPIVLHNREGETITVYTRNQAEALLAAGEWHATPPAAEKQLAALEGEGAATFAAIVAPAPATPEPAPEVKPAKATGKRPTPAKGKGGL